MNQDNKRPPFRAEHVGSFPRPDRLLKARQDYADGRISNEDLKNTEADCIREIVALQERVGIGAVTDGEFPKAIRVIEKLPALRLTKAAELAEAAVEETLAYYAFPEEHSRRIRTNNPLERLLREIRRRTRVVGSFPDGESALNLAAARLRHVAGTAWSTKRYLNIGLLKDQQMTGAITA